MGHEWNAIRMVHMEGLLLNLMQLQSRNNPRQPQQPVEPEQSAETQHSTQPEQPEASGPGTEGNNVLIPGIIVGIVVIDAIVIVLKRNKVK